MKPDEVGIIIDYFHSAGPEHLETLGVDPTRLPDRESWRQRFIDEHDRPVEQRKVFAVIWVLDGSPFGFSTADRIVYGREAFMHLHIPDVGRRRSGIGSECVRRSVRLYFEALRLERLFCEPNAFNVAPNRTLQKAGFRYVKTHRTVPGLLNYHQAVTRWVYDGKPVSE
jgi:RimJ/RimL family protein N-acetyltransferase